jgi:hypothetical protein
MSIFTPPRAALIDGRGFPARTMRQGGDCLKVAGNKESAMNIQDIITRAESAHAPYHAVEVVEADGNLSICVRGVQDDTATHVTTRKALGAVGDAIGIPNELWIKGQFMHSGNFASVSLPLADVLAAITEEVEAED